VPTAPLCPALPPSARAPPLPAGLAVPAPPPVAVGAASSPSTTASSVEEEHAARDATTIIADQRIEVVLSARHIVWSTLFRLPRSRRARCRTDRFLMYPRTVSTHRRLERRSPPRPEDWVPPLLPRRHGPLASVLGNAFEELRIGVSLWVSDAWWHPIHWEPNITRFEDELGVPQRRWAYNDRSLNLAVRERRLVRGEHAGFRDLFVPVPDGDRVDGVLVAGQFAVAEPTAAQVLERWHELTGSQGHLGDPVFSRYLAATLSTLTLEGPLLDAFERMMTCYAGVVGVQGSPEVLAAEAAAMRQKLQTTRLPERMWDAARRLVDERTARPAAPLDHGEMAALGLERAPQHVVVGLLAGRRNDSAPIDDVIRRFAFQRAAARLARRQGGVVCGQVGDHGVALLVDARGPASRTREKLMDMAARAAATARRFGLTLHAGISQATEPAALPGRYRGALWAAEKALSAGRGVVYGDPRPERSAKALRELRADFGKSVGEPSALLSPRFDRYVEAVLAHTGHRLEPTRAQLEVGLERIVEPLLAAGLLDPKSFDGLFAALEQQSEDARTVMDLLTAYRQVVSEVEVALRSPTVARQDRGTRRAVEFIRDHLGESLTRGQVARVAGFASDYFARIFRREEGTSLGRYTQRLRIDRAKQLLSGTAMGVEQVRKLSGFRTRTHFHRVFKKAVGVTPTKFRERSQIG
jgi:AraC-like DNA-binding protein